MQKRLRIMLFGAFLLCVLMGGFFAFSHVTGPAHAYSQRDEERRDADFRKLGIRHGKEACYIYKHGEHIPDTWSNIPSDQRDNYDRNWYIGYHQVGC